MFIDHEHSFARASLLTVFIMIVVSAPSLFAQNNQMPITASKDAFPLFVAGREKVENLEDAGMLFEQATEKDPNFAMAYLFAGRTNPEFRENLAKAVSLVDKVSPGEREWILAVNDNVNGNTVGWKQHLDKLIALHPGDKRVQTQMGFYYRNLGDNENALRYFKESVKLDPKYAPAYNNIGYAYMGLEKFPDAEAAFKTYINLIPNNPNPYDSYAELLMKSGKFDESIAQYKKALSVDSKFFNSYRGIGNNYVYKGDYLKARDTYKTMYFEAPDDNGRDLALVAMINSYIAERDIDKALETNNRRQAAAVLNDDAGSLIGIHNLAGFIQLEAGRLDDAAKSFAKADEYRKDPSLPAVSLANRMFGGMVSNARLLIARKQFDAAKAELEKIRQDVDARKNVTRERTYNELEGHLALAQENFSKAVDSFSKANPADPYVWYYKAVALEGAGDKKAAADLRSKVAHWNSLYNPGFALVHSRIKSQMSSKVN